jgi:hypothetical protein
MMAMKAKTLCGSCGTYWTRSRHRRSNEYKIRIKTQLCFCEPSAELIVVPQ